MRKAPVKRAEHFTEQCSTLMFWGSSIRLTTLFGGENLVRKCSTLFDGVQKLHRTFPLFSMFGEMLYAFDHLAEHFFEQSHSFLHPRMRTIELCVPRSQCSMKCSVHLTTLDRTLKSFGFFSNFNVRWNVRHVWPGLYLAVNACFEECFITRNDIWIS